METAIVNIGKIVSGDISKGILDANAVLIRDGKIAKVGTKEEIDFKNAQKVIDVNGLCIIPGLIDAHAHTVIGDWSPSLRMLGWMEMALNGGVTTMISQGELQPGRPRTLAGIKALAILANETFKNLRPGGVQKVHAGALWLGKGLREEDFKELREQGVWLIGEIGVYGFTKAEDVAPMVRWAQKYGMKVPMHSGGMSIPGSKNITADDIMKVHPDIVAHISGGPTSLPIEDIKQLIDETDFTFDAVFIGNLKMTCEVIDILRKRGELHRLALGSDGVGNYKDAVFKLITWISSLTNLPAEKAIALATGTTADIYGLNTGKIEEGREADLLVIDVTPGSVGRDALHSIEIGDDPAIVMIMVDGQTIPFKARLGSTKHIKVNGVETVFGT